MSNLLIINPTLPEDGLDYVFAKMGAIYGASFNRQFEGMNPDFVRQVWSEELGEFLKSKKILDHAFRQMDGDYPPSAIRFRQLCRSSEDIYDMTTLLGINRLANELEMPGWDQMEQWSIYRQKVINLAKKKGLI